MKAKLSLLSMLLASVLTLPRPSDAQACSQPVYPAGVQLNMRGEVAQSAKILVDFYGDGDDLRIRLEDSSGSDVPLEKVWTKALGEEPEGFHRRVTFAPKSKLAPGRYTRVNMEKPEDQFFSAEHFDTSSTFTVTPAALPREPPPPELAWHATGYDGPQDYDSYVIEHPIRCGLSPTKQNTNVMLFEVEATLTDAHDIGYITVTFEASDGMTLHTVSSAIGTPPRLSRELPTYKGDPFIQCVSATFTDVYGRSSEPTRSCRPDSCVVRHRNDRSDVDRTDAEGCEDWSKGYIERHPPGVGWHRIRDASNGTLGALALILLMLGAVALKWTAMRRLG